MNALDVTVFPLGRFLVSEEYDIEEVLLLPSTGDDEIKWLEETMKSLATPYAEPRVVLLNALARTYQLDAEDCEFHLIAEPKVVEDDIAETTSILPAS